MMQIKHELSTCIVVAIVCAMIAGSDGATCQEVQSCLTNIFDQIPQVTMDDCAVMVASEASMETCSTDFDPVAENCTESELEAIDAVKVNILNSFAPIRGYCGPNCEGVDVVAKMAEIPTCFTQLNENSTCVEVQTAISCVATAVGDCEAPYLYNVSTQALTSASHQYAESCPDLAYGDDSLRSHLLKCELTAYQMFACVSSEIAGITTYSHEDMMQPTIVQSACMLYNQAEAVTMADVCLSSLVTRCPPPVGDTNIELRQMEQIMMDYAEAGLIWSRVRLNKAACYTGCDATHFSQIVTGFKECVTSLTNVFPDVTFDSILEGTKPSDEECSGAVQFLGCFDDLFTMCNSTRNTYDDVIIKTSKEHLITVAVLERVLTLDECAEHVAGKGSLLYANTAMMTLFFVLAYFAANHILERI